MYIFDSTMSAATIQSQCDTIFNQQQSNQFGSQRYALLFKPGSYNVNVSVGFYTSIIGLGQTPDATSITGSVRCEADWFGGNATCNFWRSVENLADTPTYSASPVAPLGTETWGVSQAAPMRRVHIKGALTLWDPNPNNYDGSWSSGGFIADTIVDGSIGSASQQQFFTRNSQMGSWNGSNWNMVFVGDLGAPANTWPSPPYTSIGQTPVVREKPFLYIDGTGNYAVFVPALRSNSQGVSWVSGIGQGTSIPISQFYIAQAGTDTAATINTALSQGKNLILTPGIYSLSDAIQVTRANTVVLGMGLPTLMPVNGTAAMKIADVDGVSVAGVLFDAGATNSPVLLEVGPAGSSASHASNPTCLYDIFGRIGGAALGKATVCVTINSNDVVGDDFWLWRADHGTGAGWTSNTATNGLIVNGNNVTCYGLAVEHFQQYQTLWNGNGGRTYFYQSECPYDSPNQSSWMNGSINGYASYKVANTVTTHEAWGIGVYCYFNVDPTIKCFSGIEAPVNAGVKIHDMVTVSLGGVGEITHVINSTGGPSNTATNVATVNQFP